jgi:integrase
MTAVMEGKTTARTGRRRVIWFPGEAWSIVARRAKERPAGFLFQTEDGEPWSNYARSSQIKALRKRFEKARGRATDAEREKMTLPEFDSYSFRHGFVTDALERGLTSSEVAALVGNSSEMIDRVYDHLRKREPAMRAALERAKPERIQDTIKRAAKRKT